MVEVTAEAIARLPPEARTAFLAELTGPELRELQFDWKIWARPEQLPPEDEHTTRVILAGRGWGKTRTGAETIRMEVESGRRARIGICAPTAAVLRRDLIEGVSGILDTARDDFRPIYEPSTLRLTWPNGARAYLFSAEESDRVRGANLDFAWLDEFAAYFDPQTFLDMVRFALRLAGPQGHPPRMLVTTTPKPIPALVKLLKAPGVVITRGSTQDNRANLSASAIAALEAEYGNTRLGRQEIGGELLTDVPGALWTFDMIEAGRVEEAPALRRIVIGIDPAGSSNRKSDETGIVAVGAAADGHLYVLRDHSGRYTPDQWARRASDLYDELKADAIIVEKNFGGEMVESTLKASGTNARIKAVTASRGKQIRCEPIVSLYEQTRVHHIGAFRDLEDQMTTWSPAESTSSPDRVDALTWACSELSGGPKPILFSAETLAAIGQPLPGTRGWFNLTGGLR